MKFTKFILLILIFLIVSNVYAICPPEGYNGYDNFIPGISAEKSIYKELKSVIEGKGIEYNFKNKVLEPLAKKFLDIDTKNSKLQLEKISENNYLLSINLINKEGKEITNFKNYERILYIENNDLKVINTRLILEEQFRYKGIGNEIYILEDNFYKSLGVKRVKILGVGDGRTVWARKEYGFKFEKLDEIKKDFDEWLNSYEGAEWLKSKSIKPEDVKKLGNNPHLYPKEFLNDLPGIEYVKAY